MVFNSPEYLVFFPTVLLIYWQLSHRKQVVFLLASSYLFYGAWDWRFLGLMLLTTVVDYWVARGLTVTTEDRRRRLLFGASVLLNLGVLGFFKYFDFFVDSAVRVLEQTPLQPNRPTLEVLLPIGISFYTFHGISYTFDVYRRTIEPTRNFLTFAAFVAYFPQLVAGPIGRAEVQLPQIEHPRRRPGAAEVESALVLIVLGLAKKIVIADALAPYINEVFASPSSASAATLVLGAWAFALQIYGYFSGYSDIARGSSRLLGIELLVNFRQPYLSRDITEFWRTWHISLSTWLRDYLYIPLGGNRHGLSRTLRNLMLTMILGGLWHGAAWTFVIWGTLHGLFLVVHRLLTRRRIPVTAEESPVGWRQALPVFATFNLVSLAWVFFRAESLEGALRYLEGIVTLRGGAPDLELLGLFAPLALAVLAIDLVQRNAGDEVAFRRFPAPAYGALVGVFAAALIVFSGAASEPFIYFQF
jgi:alginate O-acetyltransferase complex protein AlgI